MTNEELNTRLYENMFEEQEKYRGWLLSAARRNPQPHLRIHPVREDILMTLEVNDLSDKQCRALLKSPSPLAMYSGL